MCSDVTHPQGFPCSVEPSRFAETLDKASFDSPADYAVANAKGKSLEVAKRLKVGQFLEDLNAFLIRTMARQLDDEDWMVIIGADTIVVSAAST